MAPFPISHQLEYAAVYLLHREKKGQHGRIIAVQAMLPVEGGGGNQFQRRFEHMWFSFNTSLPCPPITGAVHYILYYSPSVPLSSTSLWLCHLILWSLLPVLFEDIQVTSVPSSSWPPKHPSLWSPRPKASGSLSFCPLQKPEGVKRFSKLEPKTTFLVLILRPNSFDEIQTTVLKRPGNEEDFPGFFRNWFLIDHSHTTFRAVPILASNSRRYS
jgi:hypothetical protein